MASYNDAKDSLALAKLGNAYVELAYPYIRDKMQAGSFGGIVEVCDQMLVMDPDNYWALRYAINASRDPNNPYDGKGGMVWGVKCPTLTKHVWNKLYFSAAYPHYAEWLESGGKQHNDWYYNDVDGRYLVCWW